MMKMGSEMIPKDFLLFEGDKWALYRVDTTNFQSWVYHCCNPMAARFTVNRFLTWTELRHSTPKCWKCSLPVPENILTLWTLHNFDSMDGGAWGEDWKQLRSYSISVYEDD